MSYLAVRHTSLRRPLEDSENIRLQVRRLVQQARKQNVRGTLHIDVMNANGQTLHRYRLRAGGDRVVYARPKATEHGVGLVCIREVPKGATICRCSASEAYHKISSTAFQKLHPAEKTFYNELFDPQSTDGNYYLPKDPHVLHMVCFINHSPTPSCTYDETHHSMVTIRPLKTGDEITVDYSLYPEPHQYNRLYTR